MKYSRILPAAASIIALTATIGFAREMRDVEEGDSFRIRIEMRESSKSDGDMAASALSSGVDINNGHVYRVEIERGNKTRVVSIDAYTGKILGSTVVPVMKS